MARFQCPSCSASGTIEDRVVGQNIQCPNCNAKFRAGGVAQSPVAPPAVRTPSAGGMESWVAGLMPAPYRDAAIVGFAVFVPFLILGAANGMGTGLLMMFFGGNDLGGAMLIGIMMMISAVFMNCISSVLAILGTSQIAPKAPSRMSAGAIAAAASCAGMFCMFVIWTILVVTSAAVFLPHAESARGGGTGGDLGTFIKIMIATFVPVAFAAFATGFVLWRPERSGRPSQT